MYDGGSKHLAIKLSGLRYSTGKGNFIDIPDFELGGTGTTVVMGPNGAGKSLLLRLMHGLLTPDTGKIQCFGEPLNKKMRRQQALVFQTPVLLRRTAISNIKFVMKARGLPLDGAKDLLSRVGLASKADTPARRLSGGERQRLAIAMALTVEPKLLFLDEPTASLDPASVLAIENIVVEAVQRGIRIIFVTHDAGQARRIADDVVFMAAGRVVEHTPAAEFFDKPKTIAARDYLAGRISIEERS